MAQPRKRKLKSVPARSRTFLGIPFNWDWANWSRSLWNPKSQQVIVSKRVGLGWTINFHAVLKRLRLLS